MIEGSCLCGSVRYRIESPLGEAHHCHCGMCRKAHGAAFSTFARSAKDSLHVDDPHLHLKWYRSSEHIARGFCGECGSSLFFTFAPLADAIWVTLGTVDGDPGVRPDAHIFVGSKAEWDRIADDLARYEEYPPFE
ncbi:MAG TPA: GFA family protein [Candidatus Limnocylindrales bacterium]|nr:GFA family protein [Candidatus Limnocylindrales bacterium]